MRWIRLAPVTAESVIVCAAIFASCSFEALMNNERFEEVQRDWGAIRSLHQYEIHDGVRRLKEPELHGPFDVWNGDVWRIPVTAFHHANLLHLVLNLAGAWYLGSRLERRWGSFSMLLFVVAAVLVPIMAELCCGNAVIGFSGAVCAMLGAVAVLRQFDEKLAESIPVEVVELGLAAIVLGCLATVSDIVSVANVAHVAGFAYGAIVAAILNGPLRHITLLRVSLVLAHIWLVPMLIPVTHPYWNARYHWYQSTLASNDNRDSYRAERCLARAAGCDPSLAGIWLRWSQLAEERGDHRQAWERLIHGIEINPLNEPLMDGVRRLWRHLDSEQRRDAEKTLSRVFGKRASAWLASIRNSGIPIIRNLTEDSSDSSPDIDLTEFALDRKLDLPPNELGAKQLNQPRPMVPILRNDAVEGETL